MICGDGVVDQGETCDDGNTSNNDGCGATCATEHGFSCTGAPSVCTATCGDGVVASSETCDDGNTAASDGCSSTCTVESGFSCMGEPSACKTGCADGIVAGTEGCDDGNMASADGCSGACAVESGFSCSGMPSVCVLAGSCAVPIVVTGNAFTWQAPNLDLYGDDLANADATCQQPATGAGHPDVVFQVALLAGDKLQVTDSGQADLLFHVLNGACASATPCSASFDGGNSSEATTGLVYTATADQTATVVIDSYTSAPPATDNVDLLFNIIRCGDGMVGLGETCDDGAKVNSDGCSSTCQVESGYICTGMPSVCTLLPGTTCANAIAASDGFAYTGSNIAAYGDDLNFTDASCLNVSGTPNASPDMVFSINLTAGQKLNVANFGTLDVVFQVVTPTCAAGVCAASFDGDPGAGNSEQTGLTFTAATTGTYFVVVESYFATPGASETFDIRFNIPVCGDGVVEFGELCDDHNVLPNDGCSALCVAESGFTCVGSPSVCTGLPAASCAAPILVTGNSFAYAGNNIVAYNDDANYNAGTACVDVNTTPPSGAEIVFQANLVVGETVRVRELGAVDVVMHIIGGGLCVGGSACAASADFGETTGITYTATAAGPVFIVVEAYGNPTGPSAAFDVRIDKSLCGDGVISGTETCDDGGTTAGNGCSATCTIETGFVCNGTPSTCTDISTCTTAICALGGCTGTLVTGTAAGVPAAIPDNLPAGGAMLSIPIAATGTVTKMAMRFNATHTFDADVGVWLKGPTGGELNISTDNGGGNPNYTGTIFRSGASTAINAGTAPFTGVFAPETSLTVFNGQSVTGAWSLRVADVASGDTGTVDGWDVAFCVTP